MGAILARNMKVETCFLVLLIFFSSEINSSHWDEGVENHDEGVEATDEHWAVETGEDLKVKVRSLNPEFELSYETVSNLASLPLHCYNTEYPNKLNQVLENGEGLKSPSELHPIFYGCFDWHSSVHGHWLLAKSVSLFPGTDLARNVSAIFKNQFTVEKVEKEIEYFDSKFGTSWERTYGWAWLLKLQKELQHLHASQDYNWDAVLLPLSTKISLLMKEFLPKLVYPIRVGEHTNTAFGLSLSLDYARAVNDQELENLIVENATEFYQNDKSCPIGYEPSGFDFLSPCLQEADLMARVVEGGDDFRSWLTLFLPQLFDPEFILAPGEVVDRTDGKLVHLDGVNFSRAWALYTVAAKLLESGFYDDVTAVHLLELGDNHIRASRENVIGSDYSGSHWLASFLMYALEKRDILLKKLTN